MVMTLTFQGHVNVVKWSVTWRFDSPPEFSSPDQNLPNFGGFGGLGVRRYKIFRFVLQKAHLCVPRHLNHFSFKLVRGCDIQVGSGKSKSPKKARGVGRKDVSPRKDLSPLTQELPFRLWCLKVAVWPLALSLTILNIIRVIQHVLGGPNHDQQSQLENGNFDPL